MLTINLLAHLTGIMSESANTSPNRINLHTKEEFVKSDIINNMQVTKYNNTRRLPILKWCKKFGWSHLKSAPLLPLPTSLHFPFPSLPLPSPFPATFPFLIHPFPFPTLPILNSFNSNYPIQPTPFPFPFSSPSLPALCFPPPSPSPTVPTPILLRLPSYITFLPTGPSLASGIPDISLVIKHS